MVEGVPDERDLERLRRGVDDRWRRRRCRPRCACCARSRRAAAVARRARDHAARRPQPAGAQDVRRDRASGRAAAPHADRLDDGRAASRPGAAAGPDELPKFAALTGSGAPRSRSRKARTRHERLPEARRDATRSPQADAGASVARHAKGSGVRECVCTDALPCACAGTVATSGVSADGMTLSSAPCKQEDRRARGPNARATARDRRRRSRMNGSSAGRGAHRSRSVTAVRIERAGSGSAAASAGPRRGAAAAPARPDCRRVDASRNVRDPARERPTCSGGTSGGTASSATTATP